MDDRDAVVLGYVRTAIGRYGGALALVRPDDLAAHVVRCVLESTGIDGGHVDEVVLGDSNGAGEDNRNVGRMAALLAGLPLETPGVTVNRLCGSGLEAVNDAARRIRQGEADLVVAGGVESMSRAPWVMLKPSEAFPRGERTVVDTYLGWRLVNPKMIDLGYHPISLGETAENVCAQEGVPREEQDAYAARRIRSGEAELVVAGGVESMSRAPWVMLKPSEAFPRGERTVVDTYLGWRLVNPKMIDLGYHPISLGETAENVCAQEGVPRGEQDAYAARSQARYAKAKADGFFAGEIVAIDTPSGGVSEDEHPRPDATIEKLAKLRPAFRKGGSVTAGNSSGVNDGAAALVVASRAKAKALGIKPLGRVVAAATAGVHPDYMGLGPVPAVRKLVERTGVAVDRCDVIELNEAFAAQVIPVMRQLGLPDDRTNPNGGAIAVGHPIGMSGARLAGTLLRELARRGGRYGIATACIGVGQGIATLFEREA